MTVPRRYGEPEWEAEPRATGPSDIQTKLKSDRSYEEIKLESWSNCFSNKFIGQNHPINFVNLMNITEMVEIVVGGSRARWMIHKKLLTDSSKFAKATLRHEDIIRLPKENPNIFEHYVRFLYTGCLVTLTLDLVLKLYILADRLQSYEFSEACYDAIAKLSCSYDLQQIKYVFESTTTNDRLRQLCVEQIGKGILAGDYKFTYDRERDLLAEYMPELKQGVIAAVKRQGQGSSAGQQQNSNTDKSASRLNFPAKSYHSSSATSAFPRQDPVPPSNSGLFGNPASGSSGDLFGNPASGSTGGLFGNPASGSSGGLFGNPASGSSGGLFGNPASDSLGGLFGAAPVNTNAVGTLKAPSSTTPASGGVFGKAPTSSNIFNGAVQVSSTTSASEGLFGSGPSSSKPFADLFKASVSAAQPCPPGNDTSILPTAAFSASGAFGTLSGSSLFGTRSDATPNAASQTQIAQPKALFGNASGMNAPTGPPVFDQSSHRDTRHSPAPKTTKTPIPASDGATLNNLFGNSDSYSTTTTSADSNSVQFLGFGSGNWATHTLAPRSQTSRAASESRAIPTTDTTLDVSRNSGNDSTPNTASFLSAPKPPGTSPFLLGHQTSPSPMRSRSTGGFGFGFGSTFAPESDPNPSSIFGLSPAKTAMPGSAPESGTAKAEVGTSTVTTSSFAESMPPMGQSNTEPITTNSIPRAIFGLHSLTAVADGHKDGEKGYINTKNSGSDNDVNVQSGGNPETEKKDGKED